jgi:predicted transcriptional regulator
MDIKSRGLKTRTPLSNAIKTELHRALSKLSEETRISKSKLLDEAIADLMIKYNFEIEK